MTLRPLPGAPPGATENLGFPPGAPAAPTGDTPADQSESATSETPSPVPGLNQIGALLDGLRQAIQHSERWALREWVEAAKLLVVATEAHGLKGADYVQFACAHLPIEAKSSKAKARAAYDLHLLGYAEEGQPSNGDLVLTECEAQSRLHPSNFEWPHWRAVTARLRKAAQERAPGDGIPAGKDADKDMPGTAIDPLAQSDADNQRLREELEAARQSFRSERAAREELQDALEQLRSGDVGRLLSVSELAFWNSMPNSSPPPEPPVPPEKQEQEASEPEATETEPKRDEGESEEPESERLFHDAVGRLYGRHQPLTCEVVAGALRDVPMQQWGSETFQWAAEQTMPMGDWSGPHNDLAHSFVLFDGAPMLFGTGEGVLIHEDSGLKILTWPEARTRIEPQLMEAKRKREHKRRKHEAEQKMRAKLPAKRKLKVVKAALDHIMLLEPGISPDEQRGIDFIRAMTRDDERFTDCETAYDYLQKAVEISAPPDAPTSS